jgi:hypothetical protein
MHHGTTVSSTLHPAAAAPALITRRHTLHWQKLTTNPTRPPFELKIKSIEKSSSGTLRGRHTVPVPQFRSCCAGRVGDAGLSLPTSEIGR